MDLPAASVNALDLPDVARACVGSGLVRRLLELARDEDLGRPPLDLTSACMTPADATGLAALRARQACVVAGLAFVPEALAVLAPSCAWSPQTSDGERAVAGDTLGQLAGPAREVLALERTLLNLLSRLCAVGTHTAAFVEAVRGTGAHIYDTRKTTPGLRAFEKYAVRCGGGFCHRMGLHDAVLIKDNHLAGLGPGELAPAVRAGAATARRVARPSFIEVEADTLAQLEAILTIEPGVVDIVLLDNMATETLREAVALRDARNPALALEASGGVRLDTVRAIAETGVDRVSAGSLTHGAPAIDLGLDFA